MINIYLGNTLRGCSKRIIADIQRKKSKGNHILIVPDRFTLSTELKVLEQVNSTLNIEVMTFSRLAMRIMEGNNKKVLSTEGAVMILAGVMDKYCSELVCYSKICGLTGFAAEMFASLTTLRNNNITVEQLQSALTKLKGHTKNKTQDIITLYSKYIEEMQVNYIDSITRLEYLRDMIKDSKFVADTDFYIADFYAFTEIQYDIIRELMHNASSLSVAAISSSGGDNTRIFPHSLLTRIRAIAKKCGKPVYELGAFEQLSPAKQLIEKHIFGYSNIKHPNSDYVYLYQASAVDEEVEFVCQQISEAIRSHDTRYKQIAIVCGDIDTYAPYIAQNFDKYDIPYTIDTKTTLANEPFIKGILLYLKANINNYPRSILIEYAKNYFSNISSQQAYDFENYCIRYDMDYSRFLSPFLIGEDQERTAAEEVRQRLYAMLTPLPQTATISEYIGLIYEFIRANNYDQQLQSLAERQKDIDKTIASITTQVPPKFKELLQELELLMGATSCSLQQFFNLIKSGFESAKISVIPQSVDCVYVGEAEDSRYEDKKILFVIGATEGNIPLDVKEKGIIGEREYLAWQQADIVVESTAREKSLHSKFYIEQLLLVPSERLYVGYSERSPKGGLQSASTVIEQLSSLFDTPIVKIEHLDNNNVYTVQSAFDKTIEGIRQTKRGLFDIEKREVIDSIYHSLPQDLQSKIDRLALPVPEDELDVEGVFFNNKHTSISQLECYFGCPYKHFIKYGLYAKEPLTDKMQVFETGIVIHDVLEEYYRTTKDFSLPEDIIIQKTNAIIEEIYKAPRFASILEGANAIQLERLRKEVLRIVVDLSKLTAQSDFAPYKMEAIFGGKKEIRDYESLKLLGDQLELVGKIDRIDKYGNYVAVIDYKTGKVDARLQNVYYGKKIQLYVYLGALRQAGQKPCAAFYLALKADYKKAGKEEGRYCYQGQLLNEDIIIESFDKRIAEEGKSPIIPVKIGKNGYTASKNVLLSSTEMNKIIDYVIKLSNKAVKEIMEGNILPNPIEDECNYCLAKSFCGFDSAERSNNAVDLSVFEVSDES